MTPINLSTTLTMVLVPARSAGLVPPVDSILVNGKGRTVNGLAVPLSVMTVTTNARCRFPFVSISYHPSFTFSIDGSSMTIIEVGGQSVESLIVDSVMIFAGQRYSLILNANQPVANYRLRANPNTHGHCSPSRLLEQNIRPLTNPAAPGVPQVGAADVNLNMATFIPPTVPVLLQILSGAQTAQDLLPPGSVYVLPPNSVIEVSLPCGLWEARTPPIFMDAGSSVYNYANPVRRDVVSIGAPTDNVTIRFQTDNAGPWIMHCHID